MGTQINLTCEIELVTTTKLNKIEEEKLIFDLKQEIKSLIELRVSDYGIKHQKLLDGYVLDVFCMEI
jgi:hypothetical protein